MNLNRVRELAGIVSDRPSLFEGDDEIGKTIAQQMGGPARLRMLLGAKQIVLLPNGLKIKWPNKERSKGNVCVITLRSDDTYDMEFLNGEKSVKKYEGIYNDALISTFEQHTGWYLKMSAAVPEGSKLEAHDDEEPEDDGEEGEPEEDDITTSDHHRWFQSGKLYVTGDEKVLQRKMDKDKFWPNVWFVSDHGNAHLITLESAHEEGVQGYKLPFYARTKTSDGEQWFRATGNLKNGGFSGTMLDSGAAGRPSGKAKKSSLDAKWAKTSWDEVEADDVPPKIKAALGEAVEAVGGVVRGGCECEGQAGCECEDASRPDMEKALWKWWPPDSKSTTGGKKRVMFTGNMAKAAGVLNYTTMPFSDLTDKNLKACYALLPKKSEALDFDDAPAQGHRDSTESKMPTYAQAQQDILTGLAKEGWTVKTGLKIPQAISPDASWKLFFKAQAIYLGQGASADLGSARSLHLNDIRGGTYEKFKADLARWTKAESVEVVPEFRERAGLAGAHANWTLPAEEEKDSGFECMECGKKFKTVKAAEKAQQDGCPKCGGSDIDLASPKKE